MVHGMRQGRLGAGSTGRELEVRQLAEFCGATPVHCPIAAFTAGNDDTNDNDRDDGDDDVGVA